MWWPPNRSVGGMINQMIFLVLSALSVFNYVMGTICGPGFLPLKWEPKVSSSNVGKQITHSTTNIYICMKIVAEMQKLSTSGIFIEMCFVYFCVKYV